MTMRKQKTQKKQKKKAAKTRNKNKQQAAHGSINIWRHLKISSTLGGFYNSNNYGITTVNVDILMLLIIYAENSN